MSYCITSDIQSEFRKITFSTGTDVTTAEVTEFITQADAKINAYLSVKYQVPITGTNALIVIKQFSIELVANRIKRILQMKTGKTETEQEAGGMRTDTQIYTELKDIAAGKIKLTDATLASSYDGIKSYTSSNTVEKTFDQGIEQW